MVKYNLNLNSSKHWGNMLKVMVLRKHNTLSTLYCQWSGLSEVSFYRRICSEGKFAWRLFQLVIYCSSESWVETDWKLVKCHVKTVRCNNKHRYGTFKWGSYSITTDYVENLHDDSQNASTTHVSRFMWSQDDSIL